MIYYISNENNRVNLKQHIDHKQYRTSGEHLWRNGSSNMYKDKYKAVKYDWGIYLALSRALGIVPMGWMWNLTREDFPFKKF